MARELAEGFEITEYDSSGRDRAVWVPSNWVVEQQDPPPGAPVERRDIWLAVRNITDGGAGSGETDEASGTDWLATLRARGAGYLEFVDRIEVVGGAVDVYLNRGDHREDRVEIAMNGETDRGVALQLCYALQFAGHDGDVVVYAVTGGELLSTTVMRNSQILEGAPSCLS